MLSSKIGDDQKCSLYNHSSSGKGRFIRPFLVEADKEGKMSKSLYDVLKIIAQIVLPALATLVGAIWGIWHLPYAEQIVATISAIDVFLGAILMIDSNQYFKDKEIIPTFKQESKDE